MSGTQTRVAGRGEGWTAKQLARRLGPASLIVFIAGFALAAYVFTPVASFDWTGELEQFGVLRHYGLAIGCLFGLIFLWPVWADSLGRIQRVGLGLLGLGFLVSGVANGMGAAGIRAGDWAIIGILLGFPLGLLVYGGGGVYQGARRQGAKSLLLGVVYLGMFGLLVAGYQLLSYVGMFLTVGVWAAVMYGDVASRSERGFL